MWNYAIASGAIVALSILYHCGSNRSSSIVRRPRERYDYVVVGAGTAGCVVASRLSGIRNASVLLVEAGGHFNWLSTIPLAAPMMQGTAVDWSYKTEPQYYSSRGFVDNRQSWPRGKGLGGSGQLNYLVHSFGIPEDYDDWPLGWSYEQLRPYFDRVGEKMQSPDSPFESELLDAFQALNASLLTGNVEFERARSTIRRGSRWTSFHAYLQEAWSRKNLHILIDTLVTKILIDDRSIAHGIVVEYPDGNFGRIEADREIIVCAGAVNTPQLLMLSGIGSVEELEKHRIPKVKELSQVGKNLFDHFNMPIYVHLEAPVSITLHKMQTVAEVIKYLVFETGSLATNGILGVARVNGSVLVLFGVGSADEKLLRDVANLESETFRSVFPSHNDTAHEGFIYLASCAQPKSRGNVTLRSRNVRDSPLIEPAYFELQEDSTCTQRAINLALETLESPEFRNLGARVHVPDLEGCRRFRQDFRDEGYADCAIRTAALTSHHPGGTCRMGRNSRDSVVDRSLSVHGMKNLRIMDASVLPSPVSGNPNSVIIAMAEKAVDDILEQDFHALGGPSM